MGNENCFELAGGSEYRGFELPGVDCIYFVANFFYVVFFFFPHYPRNQPEMSEKNSIILSYLA